MIKLVLNKAIEEYKNNIKVMLVFGVLFVFVILFLFFQQFFFSSGTVFITYNESILSIIGLLPGLIFLYAFSFFISLTVYSIKRDVQKMTFDIYWNELMKNAAVKIFLFYFFLVVIIYFISLIGLYFGFVIITAIIAFIISALLIYVPQSIVLDESNLKEAVKESIKFFMSNFVLSCAIVLIGAILLAIIICIEFILELFNLPGTIISFVLVLIFLVPFIEQTKSYAFVLKINLIKQTEVLSAEMKPKPKIKINAVRLREKAKGGKI
ncbi:MAG: hypothetical protein WC915_02950 [archaeon]|jgi:hypothetical protein